LKKVASDDGVINVDVSLRLG